MTELLTVLGRGKAGRALAKAFGCRNVSHDKTPEGCVLLAVPDHAIALVASRFVGRCAHLSGSLHLPEVPSAHPLNSFNGEVADWTGTPLALTGEVPDPILNAFIRAGFVPFVLPAELKPLYHAAAVLTSGHAATLWLGATQLLKDAGVELPGEGLWPLARQTLENVRTYGASGRTGPFVRDDEPTIQADADALPEEWRQLFLTLGRLL